MAGIRTTLSISTFQDSCSCHAATTAHALSHPVTRKRDDFDSLPTEDNKQRRYSRMTDGKTNASILVHLGLKEHMTTNLIFFLHFCDTYLVTFALTITKHKTSCRCPCYTVKTVVKTFPLPFGGLVP